MTYSQLQDAIANSTDITGFEQIVKGRYIAAFDELNHCFSTIFKVGMIDEEHKMFVLTKIGAKGQDDGMYVVKFEKESALVDFRTIVANGENLTEKKLLMFPKLLNI